MSRDVILAIDIGNSNIVIGVVEASGRVLSPARIPTDRGMSEEEAAARLKSFLEECKKSADEIAGTVISSVVPELTDAVKAGAALVTGGKALVVGPTAETGLVFDMDDPSKVGADLIADAAAAAEEYAGPLAVFDMGTATTCSVVSADKTYLGTIILPGAGISQRALTEHASQLPAVRFGTPGRLLGKNTMESMQSGLVYGNAAMVDGLIGRVEDEVGEAVTAVATGGIAGLIVPYCRRRIIYEPDLLLKGLWYIYRKSTGK